jgi:hypothetical protein
LDRLRVGNEAFDGEIEDTLSDIVEDVGRWWRRCRD